MTTLINPYMNFLDNAREAMEFYHSMFGGELVMNSFKDAGMSSSPDDDQKVMHAQLTTDNGMVLMASDTPPGAELEQGAQVTISLSGHDEAELRGYWSALTEGGTVVLPLEKAPWGDYFGMAADKFGMKWMVNITPKAA